MGEGLNRTPLFDAHVAAGAKMVDFGGWEMPINYGSQIEEHRLVRQGAGMFDVSHMTVVDVTGADAKAFLQKLLANDVAKLKTQGKALYSGMLNIEGGVIDDLIVYFLKDNWYRMVVNCATREKDLAWISQQSRDQQAADFDVIITERPQLAMLAIQGPEAIDKTCLAVDDATKAIIVSLKVFVGLPADEQNPEGWFIARTGYTGEDGLEIILPEADVVAFWNALLEAGVKPSGLGARDTLRLEAGMNLYGSDMDESISPLECGMDWTVALSEERDFIGKEALEAKKVTAHTIQVGLVLLGKGVLRAHQKIITPNGDGEITSGTFSPTLDQSIAIARVPSGTAVGDEVVVEIRKRLLPVKVVALPFVRKGKILVNI